MSSLPHPETASPRTSLRTRVLEDRPVNKDGFVQEWPEVGMVAMDSDFDPRPSIRIENGVVVEMDGRERADFDFLDQFIADHAIDVEAAETAMRQAPATVARMLVDPNIPRAEVLRTARVSPRPRCSRRSSS